MENGTWFDQVGCTGRQASAAAGAGSLDHNLRDLKTTSKTTTGSSVDTVGRRPRWAEIASLVKLLEAREDELPGDWVQ